MLSRALSWVYRSTAVLVQRPSSWMRVNFTPDPDSIVPQKSSNSAHGIDEIHAHVVLVLVVMMCGTRVFSILCW